MGLEAAYRQYEYEERLKRVLAVDVRYGCFAGKPAALPPPIVDRDPVDED